MSISWHCGIIVLCENRNKIIYWVRERTWGEWWKFKIVQMLWISGLYLWSYSLGEEVEEENIKYLLLDSTQVRDRAFIVISIHMTSQSSEIFQQHSRAEIRSDWINPRLEIWRMKAIDAPGGSWLPGETWEDLQFLRWTGPEKSFPRCRRVSTSWASGHSSLDGIGSWKP